MNQEANEIDVNFAPFVNEGNVFPPSEIIEKICELIGVNSPQDISIIRWYKPQNPPLEESYIFIKMHDKELGYVCSAASYENGAFWDISANSDTPIDAEEIVAWAYLPYDDRINALGEIIK